MGTKKLAAAIVATYIILIVAGFLIHEIWLGPLYRQMREAGFSFRPEDLLRHKLWVVWVGDLLYAFLFVWIYTRGVEDKPWVGQGIRYGIIMTLFTVVPQALSEYVAYNMPYTLPVRWMVAGAVVIILMGVVVAGICKKSPA